MSNFSLSRFGNSGQFRSASASGLQSTTKQIQNTSYSNAFINANTQGKSKGTNTAIVMSFLAIIFIAIGSWVFGLALLLITIWTVALPYKKSAGATSVQMFKPIDTGSFMQTEDDGLG